MFQLDDTSYQRCLFLKSRGDWLASLRRELKRRRISLDECESRDEIESTLRNSEDHAVAIEVDRQNLSQRLIDVATLRRQYPRAMIVGLPIEDGGGGELALREAGCVHVPKHVREVEQVGRLVERYLKRVTQNPANVESQILSQLPWSEPR